MSTELITRSTGAVIPWSERQLATMRRTIAVDANGDEFDMFINYCMVKGLDPFTQEAILVIYNKANKNRKATIITTQAGMRKMADRAGGYHPAKPGDTVWTLTALEQERRRWLTEAAQIFNIEERNARIKEINENLPPDRSNPFGIDEARTVVYKHGVPAEGIATWAEFAPLTPDDACFDLIGTGEYWENKNGSRGNEKKRKVVKPGINPLEHLVLDASGQWAKMGRVMIAKCANVGALKAAYPQHFDHQFNTEETTARMAADDRTASELAEIGEVERRQHAVGAEGEQYPWTDEHGNMQYFKAGQFGDAVLKSVRACKYREDYENLWKTSFATATFNAFWAAHKADALDVKEQYEEIRDRLPNRPKPVTIEHDREEGVPEHA